MNSKFLNSDGDLFIRASQIGKIMTAGKKPGELSVGAKSYVKELFVQYWYGFEEKLEGHAIKKGLWLEESAIEMLAKKYDMPYVKNEETRGNGFVQGTADIVADNHIRDIKCSWSKKTFPLFPEDARNPIYEWQLRAYMMLYDKDVSYLDYCLMPTPKSLIPAWEDVSLHEGIEKLDVATRVTTIEIVRDLSKESEMIGKVLQCRTYWNELLTITKNK